MFFGLIIRLILAGATSWNNDIHVWYQFAADLKSGVGVYTNRTFAYPPGMALLLVVIYLPLALFSGPEQWGNFSSIIDKISAKSLLFYPIINSPFFGYYTKIPMFIAEIALLYVLYLTYKETVSTNKLRLLALFFYLNPLIIFINAVHAQLDIYVVLTLAISILFFKRNQFVWSGLILGLATSMKLYPGFLFLAYLMLIITETKSRSKKISRALVFSLSFAIPLFFMILFLMKEPAAMVSTFARVNTIGFEGSLNLGFINYIPALFPFISKHSDLLVNIMQYCLLAVPFIGLLLVPVVIKKLPNLRPYILEFISVVVLFLILLFSSRTNPNYIIWAIPFLLALLASNIISIKSVLSISLAALFFYFGIHSLSIKALFTPMTYFGYPTQSIVDQYYLLSAKTGLVNSKLYADIFLISAIWFIVSQFSIIYQAIRFSRTDRRNRNNLTVDDDQIKSTAVDFKF